MSKIKKRNLKLTCWLLSLVMVFCSIPFTSYAVTAAEEQPLISEGTEVLGGITEIVERREQNVKHFRLPDGTAQAIIYSDAVHRKDSDGAWQDINNNLTTSTKISGAYATEDMRAIFAQSFSANGNLFSLNEDGYSISMKLLADSLSTSTMAISPSLAPSTVSVTNAPLRSTENRWDTVEQAKEVNNKSSIVYTNVRAGTDLEYVLVGNSVKENIIINQKSDSYTYRFELALTGLDAVLNEDGSVSLTDKETDEIKYLIPAPFMYDADGVYSDDVYYTLTQSANGCILAVIADSSWINAEDRAFPVTVDPTIEDAELNYLHDTYISETAPNDNYSSSLGLYVSDVDITFIKSSSLVSLPQGSTIDLVMLYIPWYYPDYVTSDTTTVGLYNITQSWNIDTVTWNVMNQYSNFGTSTAAIHQRTFRGDIGATEDNPRWSGFDITTLYTSWYNGILANNGVALKYISGMTPPLCLWGSSSYFEVTYLEPHFAGNYQLKNLATGLYLDVRNAGTTAGTVVQLSSKITSGNKNRQLFKFSYVDRTAASGHSYNLYKVRAMTNTVMGLSIPSSGGVTIQNVGTSNTNDFSDFSQCIAIYEKNGYYVLKSGDEYDEQYLAAPTGATNGTQATVSSTVNNYSLWTLEPSFYEEIDGIIHTIETANTGLLMMPNGANQSSTVTVTTYSSDKTSCMWRIEYADNGYFKIKNEVTNYYLTAPTNNTNNALVSFSDGKTDYSLWKIHMVEDDIYTIQSKNQYERQQLRPLYLAVSNGTVVQSTSTTNNKWKLKALTVNLNVYYDQAFITRRGSSEYRSLLNDLFFECNDQGFSIENVLKDRYGLKLKVTIANSTYNSFPTLQNCVCKNNINGYCNNDSASSTSYTCTQARPEQAKANADCKAGLHHKSSNNMLGQLQNVSLANSSHLEMLFSGYETCADNENTCVQSSVEGWAVGAKTVIVTQSADLVWLQNTVFHELSHNLGAGDHYKQDVDPYPNCVHGKNLQQADVMNELLTCSNCDYQIYYTKFSFYYHNN